MKVTAKVLSIPPYVSTTWSNVSSLHVKEESGAYRLVISLKDGTLVEIPTLDRSAIDAIFHAHAQSTEERPQESSAQKILEDLPLTFTLPLKNEGSGAMIDTFGNPTQHNPDQADLPPLPPGVLKKITAIASAFGLEAALPNMPQAEPGCHCIYCQVMNALHGEKEVLVEEEITEDDLKFRNWEIEQTAEKLYSVKNPLDSNEHYSVFLGEPLGCTCGNKNCEHIRAVLST